jgi:hypothetical protein
MLMPKTAVNEYRLVPSRECDVRPAWKGLKVLPKSKSAAVQCRSQRFLRFGFRGPDGAHGTTNSVWNIRVSWKTRNASHRGEISAAVSYLNYHLPKKILSYSYPPES